MVIAKQVEAATILLVTSLKELYFAIQKLPLTWYEHTVIVP
jgi:hypothetical protein